MTATSPQTPPNRPLEPQKRALIVGASRGLGAALAQELGRAGYHLALVARNQDNLEKVAQTVKTATDLTVLTYSHDVTHFDQTPALFDTIVTDLGGLDLIVYVAGIMPPTDLGEFNTPQDLDIMRVNTLGAIAWLNPAALRFQRAGHGHIVGISSIAGDRGRIGFPAYSTSKAALTTYLEALRNRLTRHGVTVTTIKPGMMETDMLAHVTKKMWPVTPRYAAEIITRAILKKRQTIYVPARWRLVALVIQHIPSIIFRRLNI
ncbi:MAG TPA: SDR family NAD(P)-dependent oxidoreductase [Anaerolineae bacterium]|nr:SDR family NAD(P)-dependent oxidoreductase [Anaerolineae bacterium]